MSAVTKEDVRAIGARFIGRAANNGIAFRGHDGIQIELAVGTTLDGPATESLVSALQMWLGNRMIQFEVESRRLFDPEVDIPEEYLRFKSLHDQCEAGVKKFSNDQMSDALDLIESAWNLVPSQADGEEVADH